MALELGRDFSKRWLAAPDIVRQQVYTELSSICQLLEPQTDFFAWQNEQAKRPTLDQVLAEAMSQQPTVQANPPLSATHLAQAHAASSQLPLELKKRFLREADDLIEQALDPIRQQLRAWLHAEMQRLIAEQQPS